MSYLLDTNACIRYIAGRSLALLNKIQATPRSDIFTCSIVKSEMFYGSMKSSNPAKSLLAQRTFLSQFQSLPFDDEAALFFGKIRAELAAQGKIIGPYDLQIAATALAHNLTLVTHNTREFSRVRNLQIEDWE